jgi:hypothetical protein
MLIAAPKRLAGYIFTFQFKNISAYIRALSFHLSGKPEYLYKTNDGKFILIKSTD